MDSDILLKALFGCLPVLVFLGALVHFDSFKLVRFPTVIFTIIAGGIAAYLGYIIEIHVLHDLHVSMNDLMHFGAPVIEELLTALVIVLLIQTNRIGFAFDAAILGFAAGAGFALVENFYFLNAPEERSIALWVIRGFGTAIMHGGTTAIFAMMGHILALTAKRPNPLHYLPGLGLAVLLHSGFNWFLEYPVISTVVMMIALPAAMTLILQRDRKSIHDWIEVDFDKHKSLLRDIRDGNYEKSEAGRFLIKLHDRFDRGMIDKMVYYIELHTELIIAAEELLIAHENGEKKSIDTETKEKLVLLHEVEQEIGKTGMLALRPHLQFNRHEFWEIYMLEKEAGFAHAHAH